jgi:hypothetical protein
MRVPAFPIIASVILLAAPAFAQTSMPSTQSAKSPPTANTKNGSAVTVDTQQKVRQSLEQSGFKDIHVTPESFVVRAQAPDGSHLVIMLSPDEVTGVVEETGTSTQPQASSRATPSTSYQTTNPTR